METFKQILFFVFLGLILVPFAEAMSAPPREDHSALNVSAEGGAYYLSLEEVTKLALQNNFDIQLAKYDAQIAQTDRGVAESIYDTILEAEIEYRNDQKARTSTLLGGKMVDNDYNLGLSKKLPTGTTVSADMTNNRQWTDSSFATSNPSYDSSLGVTVEQELGRNFFGIQDRGDVKITRLDIENSDYTSLEKIEQSVADVQTAYWELVLALERYRIEESIAQQAQRLYELHQEKLKDGLVEYPEAYASQANYQTRLNELHLAANDIQTKTNTLKLLLNLTDEIVEILPKDDFSLFAYEAHLEESLKKAFDHRRDYRRAMNDIKSKDIKLSMEKNNLWPEINLKASWTQNGLGDHFKQAVENITDQNNPELFASLSISFPLENTEARSKLSAAQLQKAKTLVNLKLIERKIAIGITDQVRSCTVYKELARNNQEVVELQKKKLEEEQKRFNRGRSNTDTIIRFQEDLLTAQLRAAQAMFRYYDALIDLNQKEGSLLNMYWGDEL